MTDQQIEQAARDHADKHFIEDAEIFYKEPWNNAKDLYTKTLADFAKRCISHQWVSVDERLPETSTAVLVHVPAKEVLSNLTKPEYYTIAYYADSVWRSFMDCRVHPTHWMEIPHAK